MAAFFRDRPAKLRPHFKNHKCVTLAKRQLAAGAVGMTCAKLGEAEVLVEHGFQDVLIANQVVGDAKMARLAQLATRARIGVAIDHWEQAAAISTAATAAGAVVHLLVEVDIGMGRCGVAARSAGARTGAACGRFAGRPLRRACRPMKGTGQCPGSRRTNRTARAAMQQAIDTRQMIEAAGIAVDCLSGCSSATYDSTGAMPGVDEVQAGTYATMDRQYQRLVPEFEIALSVLVRVISRPGPDRAVLDVGVKGAGGEFGVPAIRDFPDVEIPFFLAEEHTVVRHAPDWAIGQTLHLIPSHACTTCNLYREMVVHEDGRVVEVWPIEASGRLS